MFNSCLCCFYCRKCLHKLITHPSTLTSQNSGRDVLSLEEILAEGKYKGRGKPRELRRRLGDLGTDILARSGSSIKTNNICKKLVLMIFGFDQILLMRPCLYINLVMHLFIYLCIYAFMKSRNRDVSRFLGLPVYPI